LKYPQIDSVREKMKSQPIGPS